MAGARSSTKIMILLQPQRLLHRFPVLQLLVVTQDGKQIEMYEEAITPSNLSRYLKNLDTNARKILNKFSEAELNKELDRLENMAKLVAHDHVTVRDIYNRGLARYYQMYLGHLKHFGTDLSWYHRLPAQGGSHMRSSPCTYHSLGVMIEFVGKPGKNGPTIQVMVRVREQVLPLEAFRRFYFLLEKENQYWHLSLDAFEAIDWVESLHDFGSDYDEFVQKVAIPLRQQRQKVNVDELVEMEQLKVLPVKRVLLNELNNTFLMLTPQYIYDGHVVEGPFTPTYTLEAGQRRLQIERDAAFEQDFNEYLAALHPNFSKQRNGYHYLSFADAQKKQWFLKVYHELLDRDIELLGMDMLRHFKYSPFKPETEIAVKEKQADNLWLTMKLTFGKENIPLNELQKMLLNGQKALLLKDGSLGILGEEWLEKYGALVKHSKVQKNELIAPKWLAMSQGEGDEIKPIRITLMESWWHKWKKWQSDSEAMYPLPPQVQVTELRSYQQKGYDWMQILSEAGGSACLADDMGLGKTLQTICFMAAKLHANRKAKLLVVCPASLIYNWLQEFEKFAPSITAVAYHGPQRQEAWLKDEQNSIVVTSYGTMRQDVELLAPIHFEVIVLDESHHIKNPQARITKAISELQATTRIALSGTPVMNGTSDLYGQLNFLLPGLLGSREFFNREYAYPIEQKQDAEKAKALQKLIAPFILRRTKEQVAPDLPAKTEMVLWCEMGKDQYAAYESIKENIRSSILLEIEQNGLNKGKMSVLAGLTKLRQICNSCELVPDQDLFNYDSIKTEILIQELQNIIGNHKALVFSQFTSMLDLLERDLSKAGIATQRLDGTTKIADRQGLVNDFQQDDSEARVFLISLKAGNAGLTLTSADYVFLFDPWWNVAVENQAIDRTHRIGQHKQVFAYRMICKNTIEEKIVKMQQRKKKLAEELVSTEESFLKGLSLEDIQYLLE